MLLCLYHLVVVISFLVGSVSNLKTLLSQTPQLAPRVRPLPRARAGSGWLEKCWGRPIKQRFFLQRFRNRSVTALTPPAANPPRSPWPRWPGFEPPGGVNAVADQGLLRYTPKCLGSDVQYAPTNSRLMVRRDTRKQQRSNLHASVWTLKSLKASWTEVMLVVSKQRVIRHELSTDVNLIFSEITWFIQSFTCWKKFALCTRVTSALSYETVFVSSCFGCIVHAPFFVELSPIFFWFKMQTGQQVAITVAGSCEMMLVPVRSIRGGFEEVGGMGGLW